MAHNWPGEASRTALATWFLVLPVACWVAGWTGFIARDARFNFSFLVLACAAAGASVVLRPDELRLLSLGEFGVTVLAAGSSLVLRQRGLDAEEARGSEDGLGQSLLEELQWWWRFRQARRTALSWRSPSVEESRRLLTHPTMGRFADVAVALAECVQSTRTPSSGRRR